MSLTNYKFNEETNKYICPECGKEYSKFGIKTHFWRNHTEEGRNFNPNKGYIDGTRVAWNKGLTEDTDERVRKGRETLRKKLKNGEITKWWLNRKHSEETKNKISESRKNFLVKNPEKVPYKLNHSSKQSFPEKFFENVLNNNKISFEKEKYACGYWLDFCFDGKYYIEIDGEQHYLDKRIVEHDKIRTENLSKNGFILLQRVRWSNFQKLTKEEKAEYIRQLISKIRFLS